MAHVQWSPFHLHLLYMVLAAASFSGCSPSLSRFTVSAEMDGGAHGTWQNQLYLMVKVEQSNEVPTDAWFCCAVCDKQLSWLVFVRGRQIAYSTTKK